MTRMFKFVAAAVPLLMASFAYGDIAASKHDFSARAWAESEVCKPCHTPHNAIATNLTGRLWAHELSTQTYTYHGGSGTSDGSASVDAQTGTATQLDMDQATRLCLSCHDGTVALDSFMGRNGPSDGKFIGSDADHGDATSNLGTDLTNDHPVGYKAAIKDGSGLYNFTTGAAIPGGHARYKPVASIQTALGNKLAKSTVVPGANDKDAAGNPVTQYMSVSCVSCHDVHNGSVPGKPGLLRLDNASSALCLTCHNK